MHEKKTTKKHTGSGLLEEVMRQCMVRSSCADNIARLHVTLRQLAPAGDLLINVCRCLCGAKQCGLCLKVCFQPRGDLHCEVLLRRMTFRIPAVDKLILMNKTPLKRIQQLYPFCLSLIRKCLSTLPLLSGSLH